MNDVSTRIERVYDFVEDGLLNLMCDARRENDPTDEFERFRREMRRRFRELMVVVDPASERGSD
jgi:hypothetical protein